MPNPQVLQAPISFSHTSQVLQALRACHFWFVLFQVSAWK